MKQDATKLPSGAEVISDVCIIGAGPAGMTAAREFLKTGYTVSLLESGGHAYDHDTQMLSQGRITSYNVCYTKLLRYLAIFFRDG